MTLRPRLKKLEQKRGGGIRAVLQKEVKQSLIDKPLAEGEVLVVLDDEDGDLA